MNQLRFYKDRYSLIKDPMLEKFYNPTEKCWIENKKETALELLR
jgi:hypothetical protein